MFKMQFKFMSLWPYMLTSRIYILPLYNLGRTYSSACAAEADYMTVDYAGSCQPPSDTDFSKVSIFLIITGQLHGVGNIPHKIRIFQL